MRRMLVVRILVASLALLMVACAPSPPPRWAEGGAHLVFGAARWDRPDDDPIEIRADGRVLEGGNSIFLIDRVGRVVDVDNEPVALLFPEGQLVGPGNQYLGHVGVTNASPPHSDTAWLAVLPNGQVVRFDEDGDREFDGTWQGCGGALHRACTLVTQLIALRHYNVPRSGVSVGVGVAVPL